MATGLEVLAGVRLGPRGQGLADLHGHWEDGDTTVRVNTGDLGDPLSTLLLTSSSLLSQSLTWCS